MSHPLIAQGCLSNSALIAAALAVAVEGPAAGIHQSCRNIGLDRPYEMFACAYRDWTGQCFMVLPIVGRGGVSQRRRDWLEAHERDHCAGRINSDQ